jgi:hypothetical protein
VFCVSILKKYTCQPSASTFYYTPTESVRECVSPKKTISRERQKSKHTTLHVNDFQKRGKKRKETKSHIRQEQSLENPLTCDILLALVFCVRFKSHTTHTQLHAPNHTRPKRRPPRPADQPDRPRPNRRPTALAKVVCFEQQKPTLENTLYRSRFDNAGKYAHGHANATPRPFWSECKASTHAFARPAPTPQERA